MRTDETFFLYHQLGPIYLVEILTLSLFQQMLAVWVVAALWPDSHKVRFFAGGIFAIGHLIPILLGRSVIDVLPVALAAGCAYIFWLFVLQRWKAPIFAWSTHFGFYWALSMIHMVSLG